MILPSPSRAQSPSEVVRPAGFITMAAALFAGACAAGTTGGSDALQGVLDMAPQADAPPPDRMPSIGPAGRIDRTPTVDGVDRAYFLYVPDSAVAAMATGPVPLLIGLHGAGSDGDLFFNNYDVGSLADAHGFVAAMPSAFNTVWLTQGSEGWARLDGQGSSTRNDVRLVQAMIDDALTGYRIDPKRIYVCGVSRGGAMAGVLAVASQNPRVLSGEYSSPFAAYAISAGFNPLGAAIDPGSSSPKRPLWFLHGDKDNSVPYSEGKAFADSLQEAGWPVTFTTVSGAGHAWLWQVRYGHPMEELWKYFSDNPMP